MIAILWLFRALFLVFGALLLAVAYALIAQPPPNTWIFSYFAAVILVILALLLNVVAWITPIVQGRETRDE